MPTKPKICIFFRFGLPTIIPMVFPLHIDTIRMELSILYSKGSQVEISKLWLFMSLKIVFISAISADPDEMTPYEAFHLGLHCLPKYMWWTCPYCMQWGHRLKPLNYYVFMSLKIVFILNSKQCRPSWNATLCSISSGSSLFAKVHVMDLSILYAKGS